MKKVTRYWTENKDQYTNCLCYSEKKGLYLDNIPEGDNPAELLYRPHGYTGKVNNKIEIPGQNIEINICSNFGYGSHSYLRASIDFGKKRILDFDTSLLYVLNYCSVSTIDVPVYAWDNLFDRIINAYRATFLNHLTTPAIAYINELSDILDKDEVFVKGYIDKIKPALWNKKFLISMLAGKKIQDLLKGLEAAEISDITVIKYTKNLCRKYIKKVKNLTLNYGDSRVSQLSEYLLSIHKFMCANEVGIEYLSIILNKEV